MDHRTGNVPPLNRSLAGYLRAVAEAIGVPAEGTSFEISDTATAYLGLSRRWALRPGQDLMLVWSERDGWAVAVETDPGQEPVVLAHFPGDVAPAPEAVAKFVTEAIATGTHDAPPPPTTASVGREELTERLARYA